MIAWLEGIFDSVSNFFTMIGDLISDIVDKIIQFFGYLGSVFEFIRSAVSFLPSYYLIFAGIIVTVLVLYLILGRQSGGD